MNYNRKPKEKEFDAVCIVVDVGRSCVRSGFLDIAIKCVSEQIQRKVYGESNDRFGLVLFGTEKSNNPLSYRHVTLPDLHDRCMTVADFKLLDYVEKRVRALASDCEGDWIDALVVGLNHLKENTETSTAVKSKRLMLFSDLGSVCNESNFETISKAMSKTGVEFIFVGPDWFEDKDAAENNFPPGAEAYPCEHQERKPKTAIQSGSELLIDHLITLTGGLKVSADFALATFMNKERRKKKPFPWKVDLEIGSSLRVPVVGYIHVRRENPKPWKKCLATASPKNEESWELKPETTFIKNDENLTVVDPSDLIESFKYGSQLITVSEIDKERLFESGPKSLKLIGFVKQDQIPAHLLLGDGTMVFQPVEGDQSSVAALSALVSAMDAEEVFALVRRVYSARSAPKLAMLVPSLKRDHESLEESVILTYVELPYMEDIRYYDFAPLYSDKVKPTEEQLKAVDDLIDALKVESPRILQTETILNPYYQYLYQCLTVRALKPGVILPKPSEHTLKIMEQPAELAEAATKPLNKIKDLFKLEEIVAKKAKKTGETFFSAEVKRLSDSASNVRLTGEDLNLSSGSQVTSVGSTTPAQDFRKLLEQGFNLNTVQVQIEKIIYDFLQVSFGGDFSEKIIECLLAYRAACLDFKQPGHYNRFIYDLKPEILRCTKLGKNFWAVVVAKDLGLIPRQIDGNSDVSEHDAEQFLKLEIVSENISMMETEVTDEPSADDLVDDL